MGRPRLLDLFCGAGGAAMGYHRAGFEVVGVDHRLQPRYAGDAFVLADALEYATEYGRQFDVIHASPPCHAYIQWNGINLKKWGRLPEHPDLVEAVRIVLDASGKPWVLENVVGAPLCSPILLCGSMFALGVRRHRLFESPLLLFRPPSCEHTRREIAVYGDLNGRRIYTRKDGTQTRAARTIEQARSAMGIDWMAWDELTQAIPPAYTEWLGRQLFAVLEGRS